MWERVIHAGNNRLPFDTAGIPQKLRHHGTEQLQGGHFEGLAR